MVSQPFYIETDCKFASWAQPVSITDFLGLQELISVLKSMTRVPERNVSGPFLYSVDHCFNIRGQGTVMTGTVLQGTVHVNDVRSNGNYKVHFEVGTF